MAHDYGCEFEVVARISDAGRSIRTSPYGNGPGMLLARADDTAPKIAATAEPMAMVIVRSFLKCRLGIPGSFRRLERGLHRYRKLIGCDCQL